MIGGTDIVFGGRPDPADRAAIVRTVVEAWPHALFVDATRDDAPTPLGGLAPPFALPDELLVYRDQRSFESWEREGATPENADTMLHFLFTSEGVTAVYHGGSGSESERMVEDIGHSLTSNRFRLGDRIYQGAA